MESRKLISATDTQYSGTLLSSLNEQRNLGIFCDVTVIVEDKKFRAHKNILSASSTYFRQLCSVSGQVVELSIVRSEIFAEILNYMYCSKIVRVRADLLEELIKAGKLLGVKFIADLGVPLSQMKSMASCVKDGGVEASQPVSDKNSVDIGNTATQKPANDVLQDNGISSVPVPTQANPMSIEELTESRSLADCMDEAEGPVDDDDDDDDDVIFCSQLVPPKPCILNDTETAKQSTSSDKVELPKQQTSSNDGTPAQASPVSKATSPSNFTLKSVTSTPLGLSPNIPRPGQVQTSGATFVSSQNRLIPNTVLLNTSSITSFSQNYLPPTINLLVQQLPSINSFVNKPLIITNSSWGPSKNSSSVALSNHSNIVSASFDGPKVHQPQLPTFTQNSPKPGELKIKIADVNAGNNKDCLGGVGTGSQHIMDGKKIITLDTPSEIGGLSTGCKVYANIGEDTYDIVIPIKDDLSADDDYDYDDGAVELPRSIDGSPDSKRVKVKHEDHYELIIDGKVYYICIVCKRSYVCVKSLKRHFNCHSWEKKYHCHYCEKVFPLAEYRTKHETRHTGEKRYQCLTCGECFIDHKVIAAHMKSVHSQDITGNAGLYRLHPFKSRQTHQSDATSYANSSSGAPLLIDQIVYNVGTIKEEPVPQQPESTSSSKPISWDDVFRPQGEQADFKPCPSGDSTEFEFVIPESY